MFFVVVIMMVLFFCLILVFALYAGEFILSIKDYKIGKVAAFERGFKGFGKIQNSFRIHFFVIMLMFVIFDLEVVMFLGILISDLSAIVSFVFLFCFVIGGFYME